MSYPLDDGRLNLFIVLSIILVIYLLIKRKSLTFNGIYFLSIIGIMLLIIAIMGACVIEWNWKSDYIFAFLCFKKVSKHIWFGGLCYFRLLAYIFLLCGIMKFAIALFNMD